MLTDLVSLFLTRSAYLVFQLWSHAHLYVDAFRTSSSHLFFTFTSSSISLSLNFQTGPTKSTQFPDSVKVGVRRAARLGFKERSPKEKAAAKENDDGYTKNLMTKMHMGKKDKEGSDGIPLEGATAEERERAQAEAANGTAGEPTLRSDSRETESEESAEDEEDEEVPLL